MVPSKYIELQGTYITEKCFEVSGAFINVVYLSDIKV